jgi:Acetyltransferase (GNAT) domain
VADESPGTVVDNLPSDPLFAGCTLSPVNPLGDDQWDSRLAGYASASFFHSSAWAAVLRDTYGFTPAYFLAKGADGSESLLPIMEVDSWLTGRRGVSLPFTDECTPLCSNSAHFPTLFGQVLDYAKTRDWGYLEFRGGKHLLPKADPSISFYGHRLDLNEGETSLFSKLEGSTRQAIRKAERSGLTLEFSRSLDSVQTFYGLFCKTRKRLGTPPQSYRYLRNIHRHVLEPDKGWVVIARLGQVPVAGAVFFHFGKTAIFKFGASDDRFQHLRANNFVMWEAIKHLSHKGFETLDFGRTSLAAEGLRRFKLGWGTTERKIDYVKFDLKKSTFVTSKDYSSGSHTRLFQILPVPLSRLIGATLYKHTA